MMMLLCFSRVAKWAADKDYKGKIAYFMEAGHKEQEHVDLILRTVESDQALLKALRYAGRAQFIPKEKCRHIQTADLLAWEMQKFRKFELGHDDHKRGSLNALIQTHISRLDLNVVLPKITPAFRQKKKWSQQLLRKVMAWERSKDLGV